MAVKHKFASAKSDGGDATLVRPSNWNDEHNHVPFDIVLVADSSALLVFTNQGAGPTELVAPKCRTKADLTYATEARLVMAQGAVGVTALARIQYSTDQSTWNYLDGNTPGGPSVAFSTTANIVVAGSWITLAVGAKADVFLRLVVTGGNGTEDPSLWSAYLQVR